MTKKILNIARTLAAVLFVLTAIGAGVMVGTGKVRTERLGEIFQAAEEEKAEAPAEELPPSAAEEIARKNLQLNRELEQLRQDFPVEVSRFEVHLAMLKREVDDRMERLKAERAAFETGKQEFEKARKEFAEGVSDEGFRKNLEVLQRMEPAAAAATINNWDDKEILRYFRQMKSSVLTEIIAELNKYPAKATEGRRGAELLNKLDEFEPDHGTGTVSS